jgi:hypothetical protein
MFTRNLTSPKEAIIRDITCIGDTIVFYTTITTSKTQGSLQFYSFSDFLLNDYNPVQDSISLGNVTLKSNPVSDGVNNLVYLTEDAFLYHITFQPDFM